MFVYDFRTEISIKIIRTVPVVSESKPALLTHCKYHCNRKNIVVVFIGLFDLGRKVYEG